MKRQRISVISRIDTTIIISMLGRRGLLWNRSPTGDPVVWAAHRRHNYHQWIWRMGSSSWPCMVAEIPRNRTDLCCIFESLLKTLVNGDKNRMPEKCRVVCGKSVGGLRNYESDWYSRQRGAFTRTPVPSPDATCVPLMIRRQKRKNTKEFLRHKETFKSFSVV